MIAITSEQGALIRTLPVAEGIFGFHGSFGFISQEAAKERTQNRKRFGFKDLGHWFFRFSLKSAGSGAVVVGLEGCDCQKLEDGSWKLQTERGVFHLRPVPAAIPVARLAATEDHKERMWRYALLLALLCTFLVRLIPGKKAEETIVQIPIAAPVTVKVVEPKRVVVVAPTQIPIPTIKNLEQAKRVAVQQNLGFLGLLGKKDLTKALGGMPSTTGPATPGAGPGGTGGSGGELLVGLGQGVKRTTVGNTGVQGLGGLGNAKGPGGGAGGYGDSLVGSGHGRALSSLGANRNVIPLSKDIELEGGLDRAVIEATIAKYVSQVRACYERGLEKNPGLVGKISMDFEIGAAGMLNYARIGKSSLGSPDVEQCIAGKMLEWAFPKPLGGVSVKVSYPFLLRPSNS